MKTIQSINPARVSPVLPVFIIIDGSGSMAYDMDNKSRFEHAIEALCTQIEQMRKNAMLLDTVELTVIVCAGEKPTVALEPTKLCDVDLVKLLRSLGKPHGVTPMGQSMLDAIRLADERKAELARSGAPYMQPLISLLTDGVPTDDDVMEQAYALVNERQADKKLCFIACGVADDHPEMLPVLKRLCKGGADPLHVRQAKDFVEYIRLLNKTVRTMQRIERPSYAVTPISSFPAVAPV